MARALDWFGPLIGILIGLGFVLELRIKQFNLLKKNLLKKTLT
jgi:hypothetical protein